MPPGYRESPPGEAEGGLKTAGTTGRLLAQEVIESMPELPLREPWFLTGRTSVLQRPVLTSAALRGLTLAAGVLGKIGFLLTMTSPGSIHLASVASCIGDAALSLAVATPYARWQGDSEITATRRL